MLKSANVKTKLTILQRRDCVGPEAVREQGAVGGDSPCVLALVVSSSTGIAFGQRGWEGVWGCCPDLRFALMFPIVCLQPESSQVLFFPPSFVVK